jgi:hypothetical protein
VVDDGSVGVVGLLLSLLLVLVLLILLVHLSNGPYLGSECLEELKLVII